MILLYLWQIYCLPGLIFHELSHLITARLLFSKIYIKHINLLHRYTRENGKQALLSEVSLVVESNMLIKSFLIAIAPLIFSITLIILLMFYMENITLFAVICCYMMSVTNILVPSEADRIVIINCINIWNKQIKLWKLRNKNDRTN